MEAIQLFANEVKHGAVWMCRKCGTLFTRQYQPIGEQGGRRYTPEERDDFARKSAERCCDHRCEECGEKAFSDWQTLCQKHLDERQAERERRKERAAFEKAEKFTPDDTVEDCMLYDARGDRWFRDLDEALDHYADDDEASRPEYLWLSRRVRWSPDVSAYIADRMYDHYDGDAADRIPKSEWQRLEAMVLEWWEGNGVESYKPDYSRCLMLGPMPDVEVEARQC